MRRGLPTAGLAALTALAVATLQPTSTRAGEAAAALAEAIGPAEARRAIDGVATVARGEGPNGAFVTEIVALADGRTRFAQSAGDRRTELLAVLSSKDEDEELRTAAADLLAAVERKMGLPVPNPPK